MNFEKWLESLSYAQCCALASQSRIADWMAIPPDKIRQRLVRNKDAEAIFEANS